MNLLDQTLSGDEPIVQAIEAACGPIAAVDFVAQHNNWCTQFVGFEEYIDSTPTFGRFLAPKTNVSTAEH